MKYYKQNSFLNKLITIIDIKIELKKYTIKEMQKIGKIII